MTPLVGLNQAKTFVGFETEDQGVKVLVAELPAEAYGEVANAFKANPGGAGGIKPESIETAAGLAYYTVENAKDGATNVRRYSMILPGPTFSGYVAVQVPENASRIYTDDAMRQMFASAAIRKEVPVEEQLGLMPFKVGELSELQECPHAGAGRRPHSRRRRRKDRLRGRALHDHRPDRLDARLSPTIAAASPSRSRPRFPACATARITMSEPLRIDGQPGYETRIDAISGKDNTPVTIVQWLRFGAQTSMRIIGCVAARGMDQGVSALPRRARRHSAARLRLQIGEARRIFGLSFVSTWTCLSSTSGLRCPIPRHLSCSKWPVVRRHSARRA